MRHEGTYLSLMILAFLFLTQRAQRERKERKGYIKVIGYSILRERVVVLEYPQLPEASSVTEEQNILRSRE
jgi:hypothetical protein